MSTAVYRVPQVGLEKAQHNVFVGDCAFSVSFLFANLLLILFEQAMLSD